MTSRRTRRNCTETLVNISNAELARLERENRQRRLTADMAEQDNEMAAQVQMLRDEIEMMRRERQEAPQPQPGIGDTDNPHAYYRNRAAIVPPTIQRQDFEIKPQLISLVKQHLFHGLPAEIPMDHIENFEEICSTTGSNGMPSEFIKCKLFPFSLADKASRWLKSLPSGSLTSWAGVRAAFLDHFYTKSKTAALRNKISSFQQHSGEAFCEAWERLKEYRRECPHHGFKDEQILGIFYDGVEWDYRNALNAASNGDFMTKTKEGAFALIENLASSSSNKSPEYDRSKKINSMETQKIDELTAKVNQLLRGNKSVHFVDESGNVPISRDFEEDDDAAMQEINYVNGQGFVQNRGFNQNYRNHPNLSYRSTNVENPHDQVYPQQTVASGQQFQKKTFVQNSGVTGNFQGFTGQTSVQNPGQNQFQSGFQQSQPFSNFQTPANSASGTQDKLEALMQQLLLQQQKSSTEINTKVDNMYNDLNNKYEAVATHLKLLDTQVAQTAETVKRQQGVFLGKGEQNPRSGEGSSSSKAHVHYIGDEERAASERRLEIMLQQVLDGQSKNSQEISDLAWKFESLSCEFQREVKTRENAVQSRTATKSRQQSDRSIQSSAPGKTPASASLPPYIPKVPYPCAVKPPPFRLLPKLADPGKFVVPCSIDGVAFEDSLCDSGSTVNIMSVDIARRLGIDDIQPSDMALQFADATVSSSQGCISDLQVRIGKCLMPCDFQVVDMSEGAYMPLILGRPFLATAGALVDLPQKRVCLSAVDKGLFYKVVPPKNSKQSGSFVAIGENELNVTQHSKSGGLPKGSCVTLTPLKHVDDTIEYKVKSKGMSKPFSQVRAIITPELKAKGQAAIDEMMRKVLCLRPHLSHLIPPADPPHCA